jgi:hypothetical protein
MRSLAKFLAVAPLLISVAWGAPPKPRVTFELLTKPGLPLTASQQWYKALTDLGISGLQIHNARSDDKMEISESGGKAAREYKVVGILAADNVLYLPGGKFKLGDTGRLRKWLDNLGDQGADGVTEPRMAFDFTARQLDEVKSDLKQPVEFSTKETPAGKVVSQIGGGLKFALELDDAARRGLKGIRVTEELNGLSSGTALAAILRPAGLVLEPERLPGGAMRYRVRKAQAGREAWPVGWKPHDERSQVLPLLFEHLNVEIKELPVSEAAGSIQGRLKVPFLYDQNAMALHGVDPTKVEADVPSKRMTYSQVLGKILLQAKLQYELRVDEADKPFLWITTIKPAP